MTDATPGTGSAPDPDAVRYDEHWRPILDGATGRLLDRLDAVVTRRSLTAETSAALLDLGCGTGALLVEAGRRWPDLRLAGLDASGAMLGLGRQRAAAVGLAVADDDDGWLVGDAGSVPLPDGTVDIVASSFLLQLVADRAAVLAEVRRVLATRGTFGFVAWLAEDSLLAADEPFDDAVYDLELDEPDTGFRMAKAGDFESVGSAAEELAEAGFDVIDARPDRLAHTWTREGFLDFKREYDERDLFDSLDASEAARLTDAVRVRFAGLPDPAFVLRAPLVSVLAVSP